MYTVRHTIHPGHFKILCTAELRENLPAGQAVCHFIGEPKETRHLRVKNNEAVLSPPCSIHRGAGTGNYSEAHRTPVI